MKDLILIFLTVAATVYAQMVFKWQSGSIRLGSVNSLGEIAALCVQMFRPWILSAFAAQFLGALCWIVALKHMPLTRAYMFVMLTFVLVTACGAVIFREPLSFARIVGCCLIIAGVLVGGGR